MNELNELIKKKNYQNRISYFYVEEQKLKFHYKIPLTEGFTYFENKHKPPGWISEPFQKKYNYPIKA